MHLRFKVVNLIYNILTDGLPALLDLMSSGTHLLACAIARLGFPAVELRQYEPTLVAEVTVEGEDIHAATGKGFRQVARHQISNDLKFYPQSQSYLIERGQPRREIVNAILLRCKFHFHGKCKAKLKFRRQDGCG